MDGGMKCQISCYTRVLAAILSKDKILSLCRRSDGLLLINPHQPSARPVYKNIYALSVYMEYGCHMGLQRC